jgi:hypothetical protein
VPDGSGDRDILELDARPSAAEHQPSAAHVAAPDERDRKQEPLTKYLAQNVNVLAAGDRA